MNENNSPKWKLEIVVAFFSLVGIIFTALFSNWDKVFSNSKNEDKIEKKVSLIPNSRPSQPELENVVPSLKDIKAIHPQDNEKRAKDIVTYIIGQSYRRSFALNFTTRFVN